MKRIIALTIITCIASCIFAQKPLLDGAKLLFKNIKTKTTNDEKAMIFKKSGFILSKDKKQFVLGDDPVAAEFPFDVTVLPTDLNKDGIEEIFMVYGNTYTSGNTGSNVLLFIKDQSGAYQTNFGFSGMTPDIMPTQNKGYPDLLIGGPGFEFPVWRWNGKEYVYNRKISDKVFEKTKTVSVENASKLYVSTIK